MRIGPGRDDRATPVDVPANDCRSGHARLRCLPQTRRVDLETDATLDHRVENVEQTVAVAKWIVVAVGFGSVTLWQVEVPDDVEPARLDRHFDLVEVWGKDVVQRSLAKVLGENDCPVFPVMHEADDKIIIVTVFTDEPLNLASDALVEVDLGAAQHRQLPGEQVTHAIDFA